MTPRTILVSPFSNSDIRDWPAGHYADLITALLLDAPSATRIRVVGTANQRMRARDIVRDQDAERVSNDCGRLSWPQLLTELRRAALVVGNNSGITHLAGLYRVPAVCIFGGAHQRREWRPLGQSVTTLSRAIGCSPCGLHHARACRYNLACLRQISPQAVAGTARGLLMAAAPAKETA